MNCLPLCISVFSPQRWRALGVAAVVNCWVDFSKAWGACLQMEGRNHTNIILTLFFRLGCWDKKRWTFMTEWNLSHCAAMPPLNVPANASTSFINSYITPKTDDITESDQGVWTSCFHGHNLHSDSGEGRGKRKQVGGIKEGGINIYIYKDLFFSLERLCFKWKVRYIPFDAFD